MPQNDINLRLGIDSRGLERGFDQAIQSQNSYVREVLSGFDRIRFKGTQTAIGLTAAFAGLAGAFAAVLGAASQASIEIREFASAANLSFSAAAGLRGAFRRFGVDTDAAAQSLGGLNDRLFDIINDSNRLESVFDGLDIDVGRLLNTDAESQFEAITNALQGLTDTEIRARAEELFPGLEESIPLIVRYQREFQRANSLTREHQAELGAQLNQWRAIRADIATAAEVLGTQFLLGLTQSLTGSESLADVSADLLEATLELSDAFFTFGEDVGQFINQISSLIDLITGFGSSGFGSGAGLSFGDRLVRSFTGGEDFRAQEILDSLTPEERRLLEENRDSGPVLQFFRDAASGVNEFGGSLIDGIKRALQEIRILREDEIRQAAMSVIQLREMVVNAVVPRGTRDLIQLPSQPRSPQSIATLINEDFTRALELIRRSTSDAAVTAAEYLQTNTEFTNSLSQNTDLISILNERGVPALRDAIIAMSNELVRLDQLRREFFPDGLLAVSDEGPRSRFTQATTDFATRRRNQRNEELVDDLFGGLSASEFRQRIRASELDDPRSRLAQATPDFTSRITEEVQETQEELTTFAEMQATAFLRNLNNGIETAFNAFIAGDDAGDFDALGKSLLNSFTSAIIRNFSNALLQPIFEGVADGLLSSFSNALTSVGTAIGRVLNNVLSGIGGGLLGGIGSLFSFQNGGRVEGPVGRPQVAIVHGGEAVFTPQQLEELTAGGGGTTIVNLNITGDVSRSTRSEVYRMLPEIQNYIGQNNYTRGRA